MGTVVSFFDSLRNAVTGAGTARDPRTANAYTAGVPLTQHQIDAAYRGSGLMRKIIQIPAMDMVREWRDWCIEADQVSKIEVEEKRLSIRQKVRDAEILRGLGGGALILGLPGNPSEPAPVNITVGQLVYVHVVSRWQLSFAGVQIDAREPGFGEPTAWRLASATGQQITLHPSRVIPFRADTTAMMIAPAASQEDRFWGESRVAQVLDAVTDSDAARAAFAALLHKARLTRIGIPGLSSIVSTPGGQAALQSRLEVIALSESMFNASIYDAGEDGKTGEKIDDVAYAFAGAKDVLGAYAEFAAAISDIPATRLLGRAPEGMNSSGDGQQTDWRKKVRAMQTLDLAPCLERLDRYLIPSATGSLPDADAWFDFAPLDTPGEKENAERFAKQMEAAEKLANMNVMPERALNRGVQSLMVEEGYLPGLEAALAEIPDDERYGLEPDDIETQTEEGGDLSAEAEGMQDAAPRTLYVSRPVLNIDELQAWADAQGLGELQADLHVTIAASRQPLDWMNIDGEWNQEKDGSVEIAPGGVRIVEPLGNRTAVLLFTASRLTWRHEQIRNAGASWDHPEYQPHISLTGETVDLSGVEPYRGAILLGPERFEEFDGGDA